MIKTIIKEIIIMILLCACIVLVFGIAFYDYIPLSKVVPSKVAYEVPEDIKNELEIDVESEETKIQPIYFSVDGQDLSQYEDSGRLVEGNPNPFSNVPVSSDNSTIIDKNTTSSSNVTSNNTSQYYNNQGTK